VIINLELAAIVVPVLVSGRRVTASR
jgi:hypothetical protein